MGADDNLENENNISSPRGIAQRVEENDKQESEDEQESEEYSGESNEGYDYGNEIEDQEIEDEEIDDEECDEIKELRLEQRTQRTEKAQNNMMSSMKDVMQGLSMGFNMLKGLGINKLELNLNDEETEINVNDAIKLEDGELEKIELIVDEFIADIDYIDRFIIGELKYNKDICYVRGDLYQSLHNYSDDEQSAIYEQNYENIVSNMNKFFRILKRLNENFKL
jgi:hypothetical protein